MAIDLPKGLVELVGQLYDGFRTGFQRSHVIGSNFAQLKMQWLREIGFNSDANYNLKPRPETLRGSATIGVAAHNGPGITVTRAYLPI